MNRSQEKLRKALDTQAERRHVLAKGDVPGHDFHGNQYGGGGGGSSGRHEFTSQGRDMVAVRAADGRWDYGLKSHEAMMRGGDKGTVPTKEAAMQHANSGNYEQARQTASLSSGAAVIASQAANGGGEAQHRAAQVAHAHARDDHEQARTIAAYQRNSEKVNAHSAAMARHYTASDYHRNMATAKQQAGKK
jgi:hypothetical protein